MGDMKNLLQMLVKAPTLFTYSIYVWGTKIDPHKMFITTMFQQVLLGVFLAVYCTTPGATILGIGIFAIAFFLALLINYVFLWGCPRTKDYWIYIVTGKLTPKLQANMDAYQAQQNQMIESNESVEYTTEEQYVEETTQQFNTEEVSAPEPVAETPWQMSQEELESIAEKIILDDVENTEVTVEEKVETLEYLSQMIMEGATEEVISEPEVKEVVQEEVKPAEQHKETEVVTPKVEEKPAVVLDAVKEDEMMDNLVATSSNLGISEQNMPEIIIDTGAGLGVDDDDEI